MTKRELITWLEECGAPDDAVVLIGVFYVEPEAVFTCLTCRQQRFYSKKWARKGNATALPTADLLLVD